MWWSYDMRTRISNPIHSFMHMWWSYDICTLILNLIDSFTHTWRSYDICKRISNPIIPSCKGDGLMIYAHIYQTLLFLHTHLMVLWYTPMYIKIFQSVMHTWWSYDIRTRISNPIIPSRTCDGLMIYAHVYQHPGIYWTCERFRRLDSTLLVPAGKGLSIRTSEGSTVWHLHRQHGGI